MNDKLVKLLEESTDRYDRLGFFDPFALPDLNLFANLIIQECCNVMIERDPFYGELMSDVIKKHFDVT